MKKYFFYLNLFLLTILFSACKDGQKGAFTPTSSGRPYEILVVINQDTWQRPAGRALYDVLDTDVPGLPQSERSFRMMYSDPSNFDRTLKLIRNIIIVEISKDRYTQPKMKFTKNVYAAPQAILTIQAPTEEEFGAYVTAHTKQIIEFFTRQEINRQIQLLEKRHNDFVYNKVKENFDCEVWLPGELQSYKEGENFFWAGTNLATADQNFVIYSYPYTDKRTFTKDFFVQKRDSVMKVNIPGAREGMYMITDSLMTDVHNMQIQGQFTQEARGLWKVKGDMMGGPFVSHARVDTINHRIVVAEIFVYSPEKMKRNLVRQLEASLYTLRLPGIPIQNNKQDEKDGLTEDAE